MLPILHVNGYKIANPTIYKAMSDEELTKLFEGFGWHPLLVEGEDRLDVDLAVALDPAYAEIKSVQEQARSGDRPERPRWPMIVLRSLKGWTGPKVVTASRVEGTSKAHQVPAMEAKSNAEHLRTLEEWLRSYETDELFDESGSPIEEILAACPRASSGWAPIPTSTGAGSARTSTFPELERHALDVESPGATKGSSLAQLGKYFADVFGLNREQRNFRIVCPDEVASNRLGAVFEVENHAFQWPLDPVIDTGHAPDGRIMEVLSEHNCQGWLQGYVLTGRHGVFPCYEAFIPIVDGMVNQYSKFLKMSEDEAPWREPVAGLNYVLTSVGWRQDHNGYSHQMPGFINSMLNRKEDTRRVYLPPDANTLLATFERVLQSKRTINLVIASKHPLPQWLSIDEAREHVARGATTWEWASSEPGDPDVVLAGCGTIPTLELLAATSLLHDPCPTCGCASSGSRTCSRWRAPRRIPTGCRRATSTPCSHQTSR